MTQLILLRFKIKVLDCCHVSSRTAQTIFVCSCGSSLAPTLTVVVIAHPASIGNTEMLEGNAPIISYVHVSFVLLYEDYYHVGTCFLYDCLSIYTEEYH